MIQIIIIIIIIIIIVFSLSDRLVGLVVSVSDYWSWGRGFDPRYFHKLRSSGYDYESWNY